MPDHIATQLWPASSRNVEPYHGIRHKNWHASGMNFNEFKFELFVFNGKSERLPAHLLHLWLGFCFCVALSTTKQKNTTNADKHSLTLQNHEMNACLLQWEIPKLDTNLLSPHFERGWGPESTGGEVFCRHKNKCLPEHCVKDGTQRWARTFRQD